MKIVFINRYFSPDYSATSQILTDLSKYLADEDNEIVVITSRQLYDDSTAELSRVEFVGKVRVLRVSSTRFGRSRLFGRILDYLSFYFSSAWILARIVTRDCIVVAKTDPPLVSVVAMAVSSVKGAKLVNWLQDLFPEVAVVLGVKAARGPVGVVVRWLRDLSLRYARANVVLGKRMAEMVAGRGVAPAAIRVIPNWADDGAVVPIADCDNHLLAEWDLSGKFVVGYSGNLGRAHEFDTILGAAEQLKANHEVVFLFIGGGAQLAPVKAAVADRKLQNVIFKAYQPREMLAYSLGVADLHFVALQPSLEGLIVPSKFYGIAAAGRAVAFIGDRDGEIGRVIRRFDCGEAFSVGDVEGVVGYIRRLALNREEVERLGVNARRAIDAEFSQKRSLAKWDEVLRSV